MCPAWGDLLEYHFEASPRQGELRAHLAACPACEEALAGIARALAAGREEGAAVLPDAFWDSQRRAIMAKLPPERGGFKMFRLWPALAASACAVVLGIVLLRPAAPLPADDERLLDALIEKAAPSPAREWIDSLATDPELRPIREVYAVGDVL